MELQNLTLCHYFLEFSKIAFDTNFENTISSPPHALHVDYRGNSSKATLVVGSVIS